MLLALPGQAALVAYAGAFPRVSPARPPAEPKETLGGGHVPAGSKALNSSPSPQPPECEKAGV